MRLNWQQASSNYRLRKKKQQNSGIKDRTRQLNKGKIEKSHDGTGGRLGTGNLGPEPDKNEDRECEIIKREMRRYRLTT